MKNEKITPTFFSKTEKSNTARFCSDKINFFKTMITKTILSIQKYKTLDIISASDVNISIQNLELLYSNLNKLSLILKKNSKINFDDIIGNLQHINNELSAIFRSYGTERMDDLIAVAMGIDFYKTIMNNDIYNVISDYVHPIGYKVIPWRDDHESKKKNTRLAKNRIVEDYMIVETSKNFDCFDLARTSRNFQKKVYGIKVALHSATERKTLILLGLVDDVLIECISHKYIHRKLDIIHKEKPTDPDFQTRDFKRFISSLTIKELLIYNNKELYQRFVGYINQINLIKQKPISQNIKEFVGSELYGQRRTLIQLLIKHKNPEFQYLAYLLYDLLSNDTNGQIDTLEQTILFDSLPWNIKKFFRDAMKTTIDYTKTLANFDNSQIPIEQQICLLKAPDNVKEKAMLKLKEVKAKSEDSGSKARQYLDGLLKIPFDIYRREEILSIMSTIKDKFNTVMRILKLFAMNMIIPSKPLYSSLEIAKYMFEIRNNILKKIKKRNIKKLIEIFTKTKRDILIVNTCYINNIIKKLHLDCSRLCHSGKKNKYMKDNMINFIQTYIDNCDVIMELERHYPNKFHIEQQQLLHTEIEGIEKLSSKIASNVHMMNDTLDESVHGHKNAKRQLQRIIGQWITGNQDGYCFGFEGPPGVGKTSLAKNGLAKCLQNENGDFRPFAFIALGGSSNGSTLCGHNYTYVGSTWGRISDILMETKCMNPIIFIDELDKVSGSERGKEIIGILTHLVDSTQNNSFQDNYFSGIDLDLSKALFIFSYNDPSLIDKVLLDRIHRIKFEVLTMDEKLVIAKDYLLPEIYKNIGLENCIQFNDGVIQFIIQSYTREAGVRKLKEILFEIISEINLEILQQQTSTMNLPFIITKELIVQRYLVERNPIIRTTIHNKPSVGIITGLWANSLGNGGILPIECNYFIAPNPLDFKLTGLQGDVMKESMNVAKTLAWKLTPKGRQTELVKEFKKMKMQGVHIHCPEGATPKDGPSAGTAITVVIYSLFNKKRIKNNIAITGEINLQGNITIIGGLDLKILGGINSGVTEFIFPKQNEKDFKKFMEKYSHKSFIDNIKFHPVSHIKDVLTKVFVN